MKEYRVTVEDAAGRAVYEMATERKDKAEFVYMVKKDRLKPGERIRFEEAVE